jgi:hypothetical protein
VFCVLTGLPKEADLVESVFMATASMFKLGNELLGFAGGCLLACMNCKNQVLGKHWQMRAKTRKFIVLECLVPILDFMRLFINLTPPYLSPLLEG